MVPHVVQLPQNRQLMLARPGCRYTGSYLQYLSSRINQRLVDQVHCSAPYHRRRQQYKPAPAAAADPLASSVVELASIDPPVRQPLTQQQLLDVGAQFVRLWFAGIARGPQAVQQELHQVLDTDVVIRADCVRMFQDSRGFPQVLAELERAHLEYHRSEHRPMLYAASVASQRVYALVEGRYQDVGALPGHPATFRVSKVHHILALQVAGGRVVRLWLRRQLTEEDKDELLHEPLACYSCPFPRESLRLADAATHDAMEDKMVVALTNWWQAWASPASPSPAAAAVAVAEAGAASPAASTSSTASIDGSSSSSVGHAGRSSRAHRSGKSHALSAAAQLLASGFKMWDAYGLYPAMRGQGRRHMSKEAAVQYLERLRYSHKISVEIVDVAVAEGSLACFTHWQAKLEPKWPAASPSTAAGATVGANVGAAAVAGAAATAAAAAAGSDWNSSDSNSVAIGSAGQGESAAVAAAATSEAVAGIQQLQQQQLSLLEPADGSFYVDVLEVDVFDEELKLQDIWMFRGPINDKEAQLFLEYDRQQAVAQAAQAASVQEDVRQARRAQREQQLRELLSWMTSYQQQWNDSVAHVQKALARQEQLAKAQQLWQKLGDQGFVLPPLPQQLQQQQQQPPAGVDAGLAVMTELQQQQQQQGREAACSSNECSNDDTQSDSSRTWD